MKFSLKKFPEWNSAHQRLSELLSESHRIHSEYIPTLEAKLRNSQQSDGLTRVEVKARALIENKEIPHDKDIIKLNDDLQALRERGEILKKAIELQNQTIINLAGELSARLRPEIVPEYTKRVRRIGEALRELTEACVSEQNFVGELEQGEVRFGCVARSAAFWGLGDMRGTGSVAASWLKENNSYLAPEVSK